MTQLKRLKYQLEYSSRYCHMIKGKSQSIKAYKNEYKVYSIDYKQAYLCLHKEYESFNQAVCNRNYSE